MTDVRTVLWFDGRIEEAAELYVSLLPGSAVIDVMRIPEDENPWPGGMAAGEALTIDLTIGGAPFQLLNGGPQFRQSEAVSIALTVDGQAEVDRLWDALVADGGEESMCGWCRDRFGVSWQVIPRQLGELMQGPRSKDVTRAMLEMRKLDVAALEAAARG
ncbi:VOC family protein [Agrococcus sp. TF02-05]|uniref:VOC family protein n=1 Tax=Agrococcus sp. TF02-05 TaxID=2815211 RepID=UPI001AA15EEE|nr:VOC family protein [Agrococcus sp. TF02-05]MBO1771152.1 VOC family protein [Agrococcus sp. TF02-05]